MADSLPPVPVPESVPEPEAGGPRWSALLDAVLAVGSELDLHAVLERIVEAARVLSGARYAALGVLGASGTLADFVTAGMDARAAAAIGPLPRGRGVLGELIVHPEPLRLADLRDHPRAVGFPENHPPMGSFLGVPVRTGERVFGNLYLTDKPGGFTQADEDVVTALAAGAGVAVDNAQLYARAVRRQRWTAAAAAASRSLVSTSRAAGVQEVAAGARGASAADGAALALAVGGGPLVVEAVDGRVGTEVGTVLPEAEPTSAHGPVLATGALAEAVGCPEGGDGGEVVVVALGAAGRGPGRGSGRGVDRSVRGLLLLRWSGPGAAEVLRHDAAEVTAYAEQIALALEVARAQADRSRLAVLEDRDRIARDLHDLVIQRLFAVGLSLQATVRRGLPDELDERIERAVDDLDETIKDVRRTIFELHRRPGEGDLGADVEQEVALAAEQMDVAPTLAVRGPISNVPAALGADSLAVLREALSNAARHAGASRVAVDVDVDVDVTVTVTDDGRGLPPAGSGVVRRSGLANLEHRAVARGGALEVGPAPGGGTRVRWRVPLGEG